MKILLVEDSETTALAMRWKLEQAGWQVFWARDGAAALLLLDAGLPPYLILCDLVMPGVGGVEFLSEVRTRETLKDVHLIAMTALNEPAAAASQAVLQKLGVPLLYKPFGLEDLGKVLAGGS